MKELRDHLKRLTDRQLSKRLDVVQAQIPLAYEQRKTEVLERLQNHERAIIEERFNRF